MAGKSEGSGIVKAWRRWREGKDAKVIRKMNSYEVSNEAQADWRKEEDAHQVEEDARKARTNNLRHLKKEAYEAESESTTGGNDVFAEDRLDYLRSQIEELEDGINIDSMYSRIFTKTDQHSRENVGDGESAYESGTIYSSTTRYVPELSSGFVGSKSSVISNGPRSDSLYDEANNSDTWSVNSGDSHLSTESAYSLFNDDPNVRSGKSQVNSPVEDGYMVPSPAPSEYGEGRGPATPVPVNFGGYVEVGDGAYAAVNAQEETAPAKGPEEGLYDDLSEVVSSGEVVYGGANNAYGPVEEDSDARGLGGIYSLPTERASVKSATGAGGVSNDYAVIGGDEVQGGLYNAANFPDVTKSTGKGDDYDTYVVADAVEQVSTDKGDYDNLKNGDPLEDPVDLESKGGQEDEDIYAGLGPTVDDGNINNQESPYELASSSDASKMGDSSSDPEKEIGGTSTDEQGASSSDPVLKLDNNVQSSSSSDPAFRRGAAVGLGNNRWKPENKKAKRAVPNVDSDQPSESKEAEASEPDVVKSLESNMPLQEILKSRKSFKEEPVIDGRGKWAPQDSVPGEEKDERKSFVEKHSNDKGQTESWRKHLKKTDNGVKLGITSEESGRSM